MIDHELEIVRLVEEAIASLAVGGFLPASAYLYAFDPILGEWDPLALGSSAEWFASVIREFAVAEIYRGVRLVTDLGTTIVDHRW